MGIIRMTLDANADYIARRRREDVTDDAMRHVQAQGGAVVREAHLWNDVVELEHKVAALESELACLNKASEECITGLLMRQHAYIELVCEVNPAWRDLSAEERDTLRKQEIQRRVEALSVELSHDSARNQRMMDRVRSCLDTHKRAARKES